MELLSVYLSAIDEAQFKVIARSIVGQAEADSRLPFFEIPDRWRTTLIKALEVNEFRASAFPQKEEQEWMALQEWLSSDLQSFHPSMLAQIGKAMYEALFPSGEVRDVLQRAITYAEGNNTQLQIQLEFNAEVTKRSRLPDYPWELAHDGKGFLSHRQARFSRYIAYLATVPELSSVEKLSVLLVSSGASDEDNGLPALSKKEQKAVLKGLEQAQEKNQIQVNKLKPSTLGQLRAHLTEHQPHIFHFDGHGVFGKRCNKDTCRTFHKDLNAKVCKKCGVDLPEPQGYLLFETEEDDADYVSAIELGELLQKTGFGDQPTQRSGVAVAVLSACKSGMALGGESVFNGLAQRLIYHRLPAVVAMQYTVSVNGAEKFAEQFYRSLGCKNSLSTAISHGQEAMGADGNQWYRPVLYLRWQDNEGGQLFAQPKSRFAKRKAPNNTPVSSVKSFVGRKELLEALRELDQALESNSETAATFIYGIGGVGKTELAIQYAQSYKDEYPGGICWLNQCNENDKNDTGQQIVEFFTTHFELTPSGDNLSNQVDFCWDRWLERIEGDVLVIVDNVTNYNSIRDYLKIPIRESRFKVLVIVLQSLGIHKDLEVEVLEPESAIEMLESLIDRESVAKEKEEAKVLCSFLGHLPLAIELVGRYLTDKGNSNKTLKEVYGILSKYSKKILGKVKPGMMAELGVDAAFTLSWKQLEQGEDADESKFLGYLFSFFGQALIPWDLPAKMAKGLGKDDEYLKNFVVSNLLRLSLIKQCKESENTYQIHAIIQRFLKERLKEELRLEEGEEKIRQQFCQVMLNEAKKISATPMREEIDAVKLSIPHITEVAINLNGYLEPQTKIEVYLGLGRFYEGNGLYVEARGWYCKYQEMGLEEGCPNLVKAQNALAYTHLLQTNYHDAEELYCKAYTTGKKWFEDRGLKEKDAVEDWMNVIESQDGWGYLLCYSQSHYNEEQRTTRYNRSKALLEDALKKRKILLGDEHLDTAQSYQHLGYFCEYIQQNWTEAERYYKKSLEIRKALLHSAEVHPLLAESYNNLGLFYLNYALAKEEGASEENKNLSLEESKQLLSHALEIYRKLYGDQHYNVAFISLNLADVYMWLDRSEVKGLCDVALEIGEKLSSDHYLRVEAFSKLTRLYFSKKDYKNAKLYCDQGLTLAREYKDFEKVKSLERLSKRIDDQFTIPLNKLFPR